MRVRIAASLIVLAILAALLWITTAGVLARILRAQIEDQASQSLGQRVTVTRVHGDVIRGVVLEAVQIAPGADAGGPILEIPRLVVHPNVLRLAADLVRGRGVAPSLQWLELQRPHLVVARDALGRWNYTDLFARPQAAGARPFVGRLEIREGTLVFSDAFQVAAPFTARFERVTGSVTFDGQRTIRIDADAVNLDGRTPALLHVAGASRIPHGIADLDITARGASMAHWGSYLVRQRRLRFAGGTFDGNVHLLVSRWGTKTVADYRGRLVLQDGRVVLTPEGTLLAAIEGPLRVDNVGVATDGLAMTVNASPVWIRGDIVLAEGASVDLVVRAPALDLQTLRDVIAVDTDLRLAGQASGDVRITGRLAAPQLDGVVHDATGTIDGFPFAGVSATFQYAGGLFVLDELSGEAGGGRVRGHLRFGVEDRSLIAIASADRVDAGTLLPAGSDAQWRGRVSGFVAVAGVPGALVVQGRLAAGPGSIHGVAFDRIEAALAYDRGRVEVDRFEAHAGPSAVHAAGTVDRGGELNVELIATDFALDTIGGFAGPPHWLAGTADVSGRIAGTTRAPVLAGEIEAWAGQLGPFPFDQAQGRIVLSPAGLRTSGLRLQDGNGMFDVRGEVGWIGRGLLDMTIEALDVPAQRLLDIAKVPVDIGGTVRGTVHLSGDLTAPHATGDVVLSHGSVQGQRVDRATAVFRWTGAELVLDDATVAVNASQVSAHGVVDRRGDLNITFAATSVDLRDIGIAHTEFVDATGTADLSGTIRGTLAQPSVVTSVSSTSLVLNGQSFDRAEGTARYQRGRLILAPLVLRQGSGLLRLSGTLLLQADPVIDLRATAEQARLSTLFGLSRVRIPFALDGLVDGEFVTSGRISNPGGALAFQMTGGRLGDLALRHAAVNAAFADHAVTLRTLTVTPEQGNLIAAGRIDLDGASEVEVSGQGVSLDLLRPLLGLRRPLTGELDFTLQLTGTPTDPLVGLSASATSVGSGERSLDRLVLQAYYQADTLHVEQGLMQEEQHKIKLDGSVPILFGRARLDPARQLDLRLTLADADLSLLPLVTPWVERGSGPLVGEIRVTGPAARPRLDGRVMITGGTLQFRGIDPALEHLQARIVLENNAMRMEDVVARLGDGAMALTGTVGLEGLRDASVDLTLQADAVPLRYGSVFDGTADGKVRLHGPAARLTLTGNLRMSNGELFLPAVQPATAEPGGSGADMMLNVDFQAGDALWARWAYVGRLRLQVLGNVHASGSWRRPALSGELRAERGNLTAFNSTFALTEGTATFAEFRGTVPVIDVRAQTELQRVTLGSSGEQQLEDVTVYLHIHGTPDALPPPDLSSEPPLAHEEILAGLASRAGLIRQLRGQDVATEPVESVVQLEALLQAELSAAVFGTVGQTVARQFGLEEFAITYDVEQPLQLRIGKILVKNLYVTLTSEFGESGKRIWSLEYRFTPVHMVGFSVDNEGGYDLLYRYTLRF